MDVCILTCYYNPTNSENRTQNFYKFLDSVKSSGMEDHLFVCEIAKNDQPRLTPTKNHFLLLSEDDLWYKECAINFLIKKTPESYTKIIVSDCDLVFNDLVWVEKTSDLLNEYVFVQPYDKIKYLGPVEGSYDSFYAGIVSYMQKSRVVDFGNPGALVAYRRDYLRAVGGLFDKCVVGGGDTINIIPFFSDNFIKLDFLKRICPDIRVEALDYINNCVDFIKNSGLGSATYLKDVVLTHLFHGMIKHRQYDSRYSIINKITFKNNFKKKNELYQIESNEKLKNDLKEYLVERKEDFKIKDTASICINSSRYPVENNILWLSDHNSFIFNNISKVKLYLRKTRLLKGFKIISNDKEIFSIFQEGNNIVEIENPNVLIIGSDFFVPIDIGESKDVRRLSVILEKIEIVTNDGTEYTNYPLEDIS